MIKKIILISFLFLLTSCFQGSELEKQEEGISTNTGSLVVDNNKEEYSSGQTIEIEDKTVKIDKNEIEKQLKIEEEEIKQRVLEEKGERIKENQEIKIENEIVEQNNENKTSSNFFNSLGGSKIEKDEITKEMIDNFVGEEINNRISRKIKEVSREINEYLKKEE